MSKECGLLSDSGAPERAREDAHHEALKSLDGWSLDGRAICRVWSLEGDQLPIEWVNKVWSLAQRQGHHPDIELSYASVTIRLTTHDQGGLSEADFALARQIDALSTEVFSGRGS